MKEGALMKAIVQERFGPPKVLRFVDTDPPKLGPDDVLVRVHAAALNPYDWHVLRGDPYVARLMRTMGLTKPKARVPGVDGAGRVKAVGADVRDAVTVVTMATSSPAGMVRALPVEFATVDPHLREHADGGGGDAARPTAAELTKDRHL